MCDFACLSICICVFCFVLLFFGGRGAQWLLTEDRKGVTELAVLSGLRRLFEETKESERLENAGYAATGRWRLCKNYNMDNAFGRAIVRAQWDLTAAAQAKVTRERMHSLCRREITRYEAEEKNTCLNHKLMLEVRQQLKRRISFFVELNSWDRSRKYESKQNWV